ncbi:hypothetical protein HY641_00660 [Candidatus Woesearchaeota archaeon]|nr:hypothetical protein [Candidatus Woesearchaeota archaeon]
MVRETIFGRVIDFFIKLGIYDVVLPFLLVFTIVFAILQKTRVIGKMKEGSNKNLDSMAAFCIAFMVIASAQLVEIITQVSAQMVILLMLSVLFLILVGSFGGLTTDGGLSEGWKNAFIWIMFVGIVLIFLNAIKMDNGQTWLEFAFDYLRQYWSSTAVASLILIIGVIYAVRAIVQEEKTSVEEKKPGI